MKHMILMSILAAVTLTAGTPAANAQAAATQSVSARGLDLGTEAGVRALDLRILHAASELCGTPSLAVPGAAAAYDRCRAEAQANAATTRERAIQLARQNRDIRVASSR